MHKKSPLSPLGYVVAVLHDVWFDLVSPPKTLCLLRNKTSDVKPEWLTFKVLANQNGPWSRKHRIMRTALACETRWGVKRYGSDDLGNRYIPTVGS